jgi:hypothetical protein
MTAAWQSLLGVQPVTPALKSSTMMTLSWPAVPPP